MVNTRRNHAGRSLIIMVKEPRMGAVKTRLEREIGSVAAVRFYRTVSLMLIRRLASDPRWRTTLAVSPDMAVTSRLWPSHVPRVPQGRGNIGERMERLLLSQDHRPAILIGSDIPAVRPHHIAQAFKVLTRNDAVFGAAEDGGFWLAGLNRLTRTKDRFRGVRWSSPYALSDTLANLKAYKVGFAETLFDVDDAASFTANAKMGMRVVPPAESYEKANPKSGQTPQSSS